MEDDDVWLDLDDAANDSVLASNEWNKMHNAHGTIGYREGSLEAKEAHLQEGFDSGFAVAFGQGHQIGYLIGQLSSLKHAALNHTGEVKQTIASLEQKLRNIPVDQGKNDLDRLRKEAEEFLASLEIDG
ncbi:hypothetical protein HDU97_001050 [Phlyctochytrium planicorne]|nr:hypothetical protein HDU97_001050 [Phlyctochytrium planicorne]